MATDLVCRMWKVITTKPIQRHLVAVPTGVLFASPLLVGCQPVDPRVECARLAVDLQAVVDRNPKPPGIAGLWDANLFYLGKGNIRSQLLDAARPYEQSLKTPDPIMFCDRLTGDSPKPWAVPDPYMK